ISTTSSGGGDMPNISLESYNELTHINGHEGQLYYIKVGNLVHIIGELGGGEGSATVGTLPTGYHPVKDISSFYADYTTTRLTLYSITVGEDGAVWRTRKFVEDEVESLIDINI